MKGIHDFHLSSSMEVDPAAGGLVGLPWLVGLDWYLAVKMSDDHAAAAGAAS